MKNKISHNNKLSRILNKSQDNKLTQNFTTNSKLNINRILTQIKSNQKIKKILILQKSKLNLQIYGTKIENTLLIYIERNNRLTIKS